MFYQRDELASLGLSSYGDDVLIDRSVQLLNPARISLGSHVRIDAFALLSAGEEGLSVGNHVHLALGTALFGASAALVLEDFAGISARSIIYTGNDDYTGGALTGPTVPDGYRQVRGASVILRRHVIVGAGSIILPGVEIGAGAAVGALSLVNRSIPELTIVAGVPARRIGSRSDRIFELESQLRSEE